MRLVHPLQSGARGGFLVTTLQVQALRSLDAIEPLRTQIDALNLESRRPCPFSTYEYIETFLSHDEYGARPEEMLFLAAFDGERLVGYLPLRQHRDQLFHVPFRKVDVLVSHDTDRPHVVAHADDEARCSEAFYGHLLKREHGWSFVELAMQDADSKLGVLPHVNKLRFYARRSENMPNTTIPLDYASFGDYFNAIPSSYRKNMARLSRKLINAGRVEVVSGTDPRARPALFELYLDLESRSWKEAAHAGIRRDPKRVEFFRALCAPHQPLEMGFELVLFDDLPIAGMFAGAFATTLYGLEMCFDREYEDLGPGHLLTLMTMRRAIEGGYRAFNFNGNYSYYKAKMGGVVTETEAVQIYKVGTIPWIKARAGELQRRLHPPVEEEHRYNSDRRRVEGESEGKPKEAPHRSARIEERERTRVALEKLEHEGIPFVRLSGPALERVLPFSTRKEAA
jgi:hypothetical protein